MGARFAFVPTGSQQTTATVAAELAAAGHRGAAARPDPWHHPIHAAESRRGVGIPADLPGRQRCATATDIPVFDELPLDLSVVAGVFTRAVQDTNSHVNLKSKERTPRTRCCATLRPDHPRLAPFADQPVHLVVAQDDFRLEPTTEDVVAQKLAERMGRPLIKL